MQKEWILKLGIDKNRRTEAYAKHLNYIKW